MFRINVRSCSKLACGAALALGASFAFADDSSMSRLTGDSYAYFNNLDYHAGGFNTPRAPQGEQPAGVAKAPVKDKTAKREAADRPAPRLRSIFHDDGGGA
jgi:hypothetical protein